METLDVLRTEKKYLVSVVKAGQIKARLSHCLKADSHCVNQKPYVVRSLYFDTVYDQDFFEKCAGIEVRQKIRLRTYGEGGLVKLEWKRKQGAKQRKQSLIIDRSDVASFLGGDYSPLLKANNDLAWKLYSIMVEKHYMPRCLITYDRFAYTVPTNDIRITFDSNLSAQEGGFDLLNKSIGYPVQSPQSVILEVKYNHFLLDYIQQLLAPFELIESANSKYVRGRCFGLGGNVL